MRGIDVVGRSRARRSRCSARTAPASRRRSTCCSACSSPTAAPSSVFGSRAARRRSTAGAVGAMLQTGALIRDLKVRELVAMMASLYPAPLAGRRGARADRDRRHRRPAHAEALRRPDPARPLRGRARQQPRPARPRRADRGDGRRGPPRLLDDDARRSPPRGKTVLFATHYLEEADAYADRVVLMAHGRDRRRRPAERDQGDGRHAHDPRDAARRRRSRSSSGCPASRTPSAAARRSCSPAPTPTRRSARCSPRFPEARDIEITRRRARGRRSSQLTGDDEDGAA